MIRRWLTLSLPRAASAANWFWRLSPTLAGDAGFFVRLALQTILKDAQGLRRAKHLVARVIPEQERTLTFSTFRRGRISRRNDLARSLRA